MNYLQPERLDRLAREYALGTLAGGARRRFERVLAQAPAAARAVAGWQARFTFLAEGLPAMAPREAVWRHLQERLFATKRPAGGRLLRGLVASVLAGTMAGVLLAAIVLRQEPAWIGLETRNEALPASYVGLLSDALGKPAVLASSRRYGRQLTLKMLQPMTVPAGRVAQLWALPKDGGAAFPVGVVPAGASAVITLADTSERLFFSVSRLAISFEAAPALPGTPPSTSFALSGPCVKLW